MSDIIHSHHVLRWGVILQGMRGSKTVSTTRHHHIERLPAIANDILNRSECNRASSADASVKGKLVTEGFLQVCRCHVFGFGLKSVHYVYPHLYKIGIRPGAGTTTMDHHWQVIGLGQINVLLVDWPDITAVRIRVHDGSILGAEVLSDPHEIESALCGFDGSAGDLQVDLRSPLHNKQSGRIVGEQIHEYLLHAAQVAAAVNSVAETRTTYVNSIVSVLLAFPGNLTVVEIIRGRHEPVGHGFFICFPEWEFTKVPVPSAPMFHPAPVHPVIIHYMVPNIFM